MMLRSTYYVLITIKETEFNAILILFQIVLTMVKKRTGRNFYYYYLGTWSYIKAIQLALRPKYFFYIIWVALIIKVSKIISTLWIASGIMC